MNARLRPVIEYLEQHVIPYTVDTWRNFSGSIGAPNTLIIQVSHEQELCDVVRIIHAINQNHQGELITIRAAAGHATILSTASCCFFPWPRQQQRLYGAASYSFTELTIADVVIQFSVNFQRVRKIRELASTHEHDNPPTAIVEVTAGVQFAQLPKYLDRMGLALSTAPMIAWVTLVGLAGTGGHGTGQREQAFSGLIESMRICDMTGSIRTIDRGDPNFATFCSAHAGLLGIVLSMQIRAVGAFKLEETIHLFDNPHDLQAALPGLLHENDYFTLMQVPTYTDNHTPTYQIRLWNKTERPNTPHIEPAFQPNFASFLQQVEIAVGGTIQDYLVSPSLKRLLPTFMRWAAAFLMGSRGTATHVGNASPDISSKKWWKSK